MSATDTVQTLGILSCMQPGTAQDSQRMSEAWWRATPYSFDPEQNHMSNALQLYRRPSSCSPSLAMSHIIGIIKTGQNKPLTEQQPPSQ